MTAPKTRRTLSSLLLGSLLLCAAPHTASSQQNEHEAKQMERRVEACLTAPSESPLLSRFIPGSSASALQIHEVHVSTTV